ncbi:endo-1,4-beta-xylanase [Flavobacterium alkalisoli]|uniref:Beta-xylanase n=1 Tax=Flavobacterium alkalisoli TaxID=2602769 RepID=A0A5B9FY91_9FLAO|nr:endo-1,4-beta-xylanase [Flavobacterium alkalisoli]QEE50996.1 endo-1,4-beta-xylanase [Flavobacterium alkalisoli]
MIYTSKTIRKIVLITVAGLCSFSCKQSIEDNASGETFKDAFKDKFYIGVAINRRQAMQKNEKEATLIKQYFNSISPENDLKWENIHPAPGIYNFNPADTYVKTGMESDMFIIGHTLVWHSQTPDWVFTDDHENLLTREQLLERMKDHIDAVVTRYKGKIKGWDVVNEALNEDGSLRDSKWRTIIGDDYIEKAFEFAHAADPEAELYYNDYNLYKAEKRSGAIKIVNSLKEKGIPIKAVGEQGHYNLDRASLEDIEATIQDFIKAGVIVNFTELDISILPEANAEATADVANSEAYKEDLNPYVEGLPAEVEDHLAQRYGSIFKLFVKYEKHIDRITFWGLSDADTWLNNWPVRGRTNYPLPFNRDYTLKKEVTKAILDAAK